MLKSLVKDDEEVGQQVDERVTECLICGKLFPRGPIDLVRHGAAVTLKHVFSDKKSASFPFGCKKCSTYFTSKEHLEMHGTKSRCNPAVVAERVKDANKMELDQNAAVLKKHQKNETEESSSTKRTNETDSDKDDDKSEEYRLKTEREDDRTMIERKEQKEGSEQKSADKVLSTIQKKELRSTRDTASTSIASSKVPRNSSLNSASLIAITSVASMTVGGKNKNDIIRKETPPKEISKETTSSKSKTRNTSTIVPAAAAATADVCGSTNNGNVLNPTASSISVPSSTAATSSSLTIPGKYIHILILDALIYEL